WVIGDTARRTLETYLSEKDKDGNQRYASWDCSGIAGEYPPDFALRLKGATNWSRVPPTKVELPPKALPAPIEDPDAIY
ncbi:MAG: hypothetical protein LBQ11_00185, partial [Candidatus Nomurabacteria bacterium]|nr:hypothetical protein [Candidatus Nomurabacteria bacterium]